MINPDAHYQPPKVSNEMASGHDVGYYDRPEVSNSDLTALKELLHPRPVFGDREKAFRFGSIVDAIITEPNRVDFLNMTIDVEPVDEEEFLYAR